MSTNQSSQPSSPNPALAFEAIDKNDQARLLMSLAKGLDPNTRDHMGRTLLIVACQAAGDRHALVDTLMDRGANPGMVGQNGRTALHELCAKDVQNLQTLDMLLDHEIALNHPDNLGQTPLHALASRGWLEGCVKLLESCPVPRGLCNQQDAKGQTPLFMAADHPAVVCMLVSYGADPRIANEHGETVLQKVKDSQARAMLVMQANALSVAERLQAGTSAQADPEFTDLMGHGKAVLARQFIAEATGKKQAFLLADPEEATRADLHGMKP